MSDKSLLNIEKIDTESGAAEIRIGATINEVKDETSASLRTNRIDDFLNFIDFVKNISPTNSFNAVVFYDETIAEAYSRADILEPSQTSAPFVTYETKSSDALKLLFNVCGKRVSADRMENNLEMLLPYADDATSVLTLLDQIKNLNIEKILSVKRQKDDSGNYNFSVSSKAGKSDVKFPKSVFFRVPLFADDLVGFGVFEFKFRFSYSTAEDGIALQMELYNNLLESQYKEQQKERLQIYLESWNKKNKAFDLFRGSLFVDKKTDKWRYVKNLVDSSELPF